MTNGICGRAAVALTLLTGLASCHSSTVEFRSYKYSVVFDVDGETYRASIDYKCHLEDTTLFSERGEAWHIRGSLGVRLLGSLHDGSRFETEPAEQIGRNAFGWAPCPEATQRLATLVFIKDRTEESRVEMFDNNSTGSPHHKVLIIESQIILVGMGTDKFVPAEEQPQTKQPGKMYYTIVVGLYPAAHFRICEPDMAGVVSKHEIALFVAGGSYPLAPRTPNGQDFIGKCYPFLGLITEGSEEVALAPKGTPSVWSSVPTDHAQGWMPVAAQSTSWVAYGDAHIEVPTEQRQVPLYEPSQNIVISFNPRSIELF